MDVMRMIFVMTLVLGMMMPETTAYYSKTKPAKLPVEKVTDLHFYLHDILSGKNPSAVRIAANVKGVPSDAPTPFSTLYVIDDVVTEGSKPDSRVVGNARGMYTSANRDPKQLTLVLYMDIGFTTGEFNGSSISVFSRNPVTEGPKGRELAVVGGRGKFRLARGFIKVNTAFLNLKNGDAVLEYNATVYHY